MTAMEKKTVIDGIVTEMQKREDYLITRLNKNIIQDGYPQLYISRIDREAGKPLQGIWVRVGNMDGCNEKEYYSFMDKDLSLKNEGYDVCTVESLIEAILQIDNALNVPNPRYDDIDYPAEPMLEHEYDEREYFYNKRFEEQA